MSLVEYPDIPRLYTAVAEWAACTIYVLQLPKRLKSRVCNVLACAGFLVFQSLFLSVTGDVHISLWLPCMFLTASFMTAFITASCKISLVRGVYLAAFAFTAAELAASLEWQLHCYFIIRHGLNNIALNAGFLTAIYGVIFALLLLAERKWFYSEYAADISRKEIYNVLFIAVIVFAFSNLGFVLPNSPFSGQSIVDVFNARTLIDMGGVAMLYAYKSRVIRLNAEKELYSINAILHLQYNKYKAFRDSMDLVQIKCHDLKHQLLGLRTEPDPEKRGEWLEVLAAELDTATFGVDTGNGVLDSIISAKMLYGRRHGIGITCVADGGLLEHMHVTDICSIFGNALDNAIESVMTVADKDRRIIHITITAHKQFVLISVENYCESSFEAQNSFPETTKADKINHGFGLKSIEYSAKKYGGEVAISTNETSFELRILLPYPLKQ